jgi:hypothetical protein
VNSLKGYHWSSESKDYSLFAQGSVSIDIYNFYGSLSGLKINLQKSEMLSIAMEQQEVQALANIIECKASKFFV